jgi:hypothetical protein
MIARSFGAMTALLLWSPVLRAGNGEQGILLSGPFMPGEKSLHLRWKER